MRKGRARWLLAASAALLPILVAVVVNLATSLDLPEFTKNPWLVGSALLVLWLLSIPLTLRLTAAADEPQSISFVGRLQLLVASARLPADLTPLVGRDPELDELRGFFTARGQVGPRVVVVSGLPGVGKSALAVRLAHQLAGWVDRGPLYADLGGLGAGRREPAEVLGWFLHALQVPDEVMPAGLEERADLYQSLLADERALVVLDNVATADQVHPLLPEGPRCLAVVTSRARLATLPGARLVDLGVLPEEAGVKLLGTLAGPARIAADRQAAREVVSACGGLPLAVRIAGARLRSRPAWTVAKLAEELADRRRRLGRLKVEDLEVRASLALSYDDLPAAAARTFRLLGLLASPDSTAEVAAALTGDDPAVAKDALETLVDAQLLEAVEPGRYRLHDLLYLFAQQLAAGEPADQQRSALQRALDWLATCAAQADQLLSGATRLAGQEDKTEPVEWVFPDRGMALAWLADERANLVAAVHLAYEQRLYPLVWQLANGLRTFFDFRGFRLQRYDTETMALRAARAAGNRTAEADALHELGRVSRELNRLDEAIEYLQQALAIRRAVGDRSGEGGDLDMLAAVYVSLDQRDEAIDYYHQALGIQRDIGDRRGEGYALVHLGANYTGLGQSDEAIRHCSQAMAIQRDIGDRRGEAYALDSLGTVYAGLHRFDEAIGYLRQALAIWRDIGDRRSESTTLHNLGATYLTQGQVDETIDDFWEAIYYFRQALVISRESGDRDREDDTLDGLGGAYVKLGRFDAGIDYLRQALAISREIGDRPGESSTFYNIGFAYFKLGRFREAIHQFEQALEISQEVGDRRSEANLLDMLGTVYAAMHQFDPAIDHYQQALAISRNAVDDQNEGALLISLGQVYEAQHRQEKAMLCYEQALAIFEERKDYQRQGIVLAKMGDLARRQRQRGKAISFHKRSLAIFQQLGDRHRQDWALMTLADLAREQGRLKDADAYDEQRQSLPQDSRSPPQA
jgi:tetratricopeptide (TPR) repeat protein